MRDSISRRDALRTTATAGAAALLAPAMALGQERTLELTGKPVEVAVTPVTSQTVRITIHPIENAQLKPVLKDGALVKDDFGKPAASLRTVTGVRTVKCGDLSIKVSADPTTIRVEGQDGRVIQELRVDAESGNLTFRVGDTPVLGLGQGGPQFDKRGNLDRMGSGQGGFRLATHGAKVPVQLLVGTSGWAMYVHQPLGSFDLTGKDGLFFPPNIENSLPLDLFVIGAKDPAAVMREYAAITGFA